jgi:pimeloyl-ACP methyl ester carboxylesterase
MTVGSIYRRRRLAVALSAISAAAVVVVAIAAVGGSSPHPAVRSARNPPRSTSSRASIDATSTSPGHPPPTPTASNLAVTETSLSLVDPSRRVISHGIQIAPTRTLPTNIWVPLTPGRLPLVVFAHGFDLGPDSYARFCRALASEGYLVAAPSFPLADPDRGDGLDRSDIPNEASDISFVISSLLQGPLRAHVDPAAIAVVGHSDGADAALMVGYEVSKVDPRVGAIVAISPDAISGRVTTTETPLLLVRGTADAIVPNVSTGTVFGQVASRRYLLTLIGAGHYTPIAGGTVWTPVLDNAVSTFLDATVLHRASAADLAMDLSRLGHSRVAVAG